jgi:mannan endo-1,4-beta-mannosidase
MGRPGYVGVDGAGFTLDGRPFPIAGANCYYLGFCPPERPEVLASALDAAGSFAANVLRIWAFLEAETGQWGCRFLTFDPAARMVVSVEGDDGLRRLDRAIQACSARGIKLILTLTNGMPDYGGMEQYARWFSTDAIPLGHDDFYDNEEICGAYEDWVRHLATRYRGEPAILAWELGNEPRCARPGRIERWADRMSRHLKSLDPDHLVAVGDEGWFGAEGVDTEALLRLPAIDFGTFHLYPRSWGRGVKFGAEWIEKHQRLGKRVGKPVLLEEFGLPEAPDRDAEYAEWARRGNALVWMTAGLDPTGARYYNDGFTLYEGAEAPLLASAMRALVR